jgi:hypothetical protein
MAEITQEERDLAACVQAVRKATQAAEDKGRGEGYIGGRYMALVEAKLLLDAVCNDLPDDLYKRFYEGLFLPAAREFENRRAANAR